MEVSQSEYACRLNSQADGALRLGMDEGADPDSLNRTGVSSHPYKFVETRKNSKAGGALLYGTDEITPSQRRLYMQFFKTKPKRRHVRRVYKRNKYVRFSGTSDYLAKNERRRFKAVTDIFNPFTWRRA